MYWCFGALSSESASSFGNARTSEDSLPKEIYILSDIVQYDMICYIIIVPAMIWHAPYNLYI